MKAFITGGLGFIGRHLVARLQADGVEVKVYDRKTHERNDCGDVEWLYAELTHFKPDTVYHLAALADVRHALRDVKTHIQANFLLTANVLEAMVIASVPRIVFTSSAVVYGDSPVVEPIRENWTVFPKQTSVYGAMKLASEALIEAYCVGYGLRADIFRLVSLVGAGYRHGNLKDFYDKLTANPKRLEVFGSLSQQKYYCAVEDFVEAVRLVDVHPHTGAEIWNVSHDRPNDIADSLLAVLKVMQLPDPKIVHKDSWVGDLPTLVLNTSKLRDLGWKPMHSIYGAMLRTVEDLAVRA